MEDHSLPPVHPGRVIKRLLAQSGMMQYELAFIIERNIGVVNAIIGERQGITPELSKSLGLAFNKPPNYFIDLQSAYELSKADDPDPSVSVRADIVSKYPMREMLRRGWIQPGNTEEIRTNLARFFDLEDPNDIPFLAHSAKKTDYEDQDITSTQLAWLFRVKHIARHMVATPYSAKALVAALDKLKMLTSEPENARYIPRLLASCGLRFIVVEPLPSGKIDGVCFWLDSTMPVVGVSLRFDRIDNLWFVIRHEIEHVLRMHGLDRAIVDCNMESIQAESISDEERLANEAAVSFCVPQDRFRSWINRHSPVPSERDVLAFSKLHGIHPGLVVGQAQWRLNRYDYLRKYQVKIRHHVLPTAMADGFGYTIPI
jgi:HTH-type transcriptional regulator/antitoxin HigA